MNLHEEMEVSERIRREEREKIEIEYELEVGAKPPIKAHYADAGWDLSLWQELDDNLWDTGVHIFIPYGYVGLVLPRSSITKQGWIVPPGVIDAEYTGTIKVAAYNCDPSKKAQLGMRFAQLILLKNAPLELKSGIVTTICTWRGSQGFGSSGI